MTQNPNFTDPDKIPLPESAQVVAEVIGRQATLALANASPYRTPQSLHVYVPKRIPKEHWIREAIGDKLAERLSWYFSGELIPLAKCREIMAADRNNKIRDRYCRGDDKAELAKEFNLSRKAIGYIVEGCEAGSLPFVPRSGVSEYQLHLRLGEGAPPGLGTSSRGGRSGGDAPPESPYLAN